MDTTPPTPPGRPRRPLELSVALGATTDELLQHYIELVRGWRLTGPTTMKFRQDDVVVLVGILGTDAAEIEQRLVELTGCTRRTAKRFRRLLLMGLVSLPVGMIGTIVPAPMVAAPTVAVTPDAVRPAAAADQPPHLPAFSDTAPAAVPVVPTTMPSPDPVPVPAPAPDPVPEPEPSLSPGVEATVSIQRLGIDLPVVLGGQSVINQGVVAHYTAPGWRDPAPAGGVGTYWLAAHHLTHGSPFAALPSIAVGDEVVVTTATQTFTYTVTSSEVVLDTAGFGPVYGTDPSARVILLQTCLDQTRRLLVHGTLTGES